MKLYEGTQTLEILEWAKRYNNWIAEQFVSMANGTVIEVGAGTGNISEAIKSTIKRLYVTDIDRQLLSKMNKRFSSCPNVSTSYLDICRPIPIKYRNIFDTVISVNVLEHIENDSRAIRNMNELLKEGGTIGLLVPAKKWAHTKLDNKLGHFRRYEKKELCSLLQNAGFKIKKIYYFNFLGLLTWIIRNGIDEDADALKSYQIWLFEHLVPFLSVVEHFAPPPIGISLIAVAEKYAV